MFGYAPQQEAWWQAFVQQQQARYQQQLQQIRGLSYQQAPASPASYGVSGQLANPLLGRANVPLLTPTNQQAGSPLQQYLMGAGTAGDTGIGSHPELLHALLSGSGV